MISDLSYEELHGFAAELGVPPRAFERDHYDLPSTAYAAAVAAGAAPIRSREVVARLVASGLREPKLARRRSRGDGDGEHGAVDLRAPLV